MYCTYKTTKLEAFTVENREGAYNKKISQLNNIIFLYFCYLSCLSMSLLLISCTLLSQDVIADTIKFKKLTRTYQNRPLNTCSLLHIFSIFTFLRVKGFQSSKIMACRPHFGPPRPIVLIDECVLNALRPLRNPHMYEPRPVSILKCSCRLGGAKTCTWSCLVYITQQGKVLLTCVWACRLCDGQRVFLGFACTVAYVLICGHKVSSIVVLCSVSCNVRSRLPFFV